MKLRALTIPLVVIVALLSTVAFLGIEFRVPDRTQSDSVPIEVIDLTPRSYLAYVAERNAARPGAGRSLLARLADAQERRSSWRGRSQKLASAAGFGIPDGAAAAPGAAPGSNGGVAGGAAEIEASELPVSTDVPVLPDLPAGPDLPPVPDPPDLPPVPDPPDLPPVPDPPDLPPVPDPPPVPSPPPLPDPPLPTPPPLPPLQ